MEPTAPNYIERRADNQLLEALLAREYVFLLDSRQKGKSSLIARTIHKLREKGIRTVKLDLQWLGANVTPEQWYAGLLSEIGLDLELETELLEYWTSRQSIGPLSRWIGALRDVVLSKITDPLVIFIDEIDFVRALPFSTDEFFAGIRDCYNRRSGGNGFERLTFCIVGVATPGQLIRNPEITPFNIGRRIDLSDFTLEETLRFAAHLTTRERDGARLLRRVHYWVNGHPYLTQLLCSHIVSEPSIRTDQGVDRLVEKLFLTPEARHREANFADIERRVLDPDVPGLSLEERRTQVLDLYGRLLRGGQVRGEEENPVVATLRLSGLGLEDSGSLRLRNRTYGTVFDERWRRNNLPDAELRRQRGAARVAMLRTGAVAAVVVLAVSTGAVGMWKLSDSRSKALTTLGERTEELKITSEERKRALSDLERRNVELKDTSNDRELALSTLQQRNRDLQKTSSEKQQALSSLQLSSGELKRVSNERQRVIDQLRTKSEELDRRAYEAIMVGIQSGLKEDNSMRVYEFKSRIGATQHRGWEWGYLNLLLPRAEFEANVGAWSVFEAEPKGPLRAATTGSGLLEVRPSGLVRRRSFTMKPSEEEQKIIEKIEGQWYWLLPVFHRGEYRVWKNSIRGRHAIYSAETEQVLLPPKDNRYVLDIDPTSKTYLNAPDNPIEAIELRTIEGDRLIVSIKGPSRAVEAQFLPDGTWLAVFVGSTDATTSQICHVDGSGRILASLAIPHVFQARIIAWNKDKTLFALFGGRLCEIRRAADLSVVSKLQDHWNNGSVAFSPTSGEVATAGGDGTVRLFDLTSGKLKRSILGHQTHVSSVAYLPDGKRIASLDWAGNLKIWPSEAKPAMETVLEPDRVRESLISRRGTELLWTTSKKLSSRNLQTGKVVTRELNTSGVSYILAARSGVSRDLILTGSDGSFLKLDSSKLETIGKGSPVVTGAVFCFVLSEGKRLLVISQSPAQQDSPMRDCAIIDGETFAPIKRFRVAYYQAPFLSSFGRAGKYWAIADPGTGNVWIYSLSDGSLMAKWRIASRVRMIALSPDGSELAVSCSKSRDASDTVIDLYEPLTGRHKGSLERPGSDIGWMRYSPNGRFLVGCTRLAIADGQLWDVKTRKRIAKLGPGMEVRYAYFSPDGERLVTSGGSNVLKIWDGRTGVELMSLPFEFLTTSSQTGLLVNVAELFERHIIADCPDGAIRIWHSLPWKDQPKAARK